MKTRKVVKTIFPVIGTGVATSVGQSVVGSVMPSGVAKTATQSVLGVATPLAGLGALSNLTKEFDKGLRIKKRR